MTETPTATSPTEQAGLQTLIAFRLDQQLYALPVEPIVQIISMVTITPLPQMSDTIEGMINVRGKVVPVVDLRRHLKLAQAPLKLHTPILLTKIGERTVGLIVDSVVDVFSLADDQVVPPIDVLPERLGKAPILRGLVHISDEMGLLLDPEHLFLPHQMEALARAAALLPELASQQAPQEPASDKPSAEGSA